MNYHFITGKRVSLKRNNQPFQYPHQPPRHDPTTNSMSQSSKHDPPMFQTSWKLQQRSWFFPLCFQMGGPSPLSLKLLQLALLLLFSTVQHTLSSPWPYDWLYDFPCSVAMFAMHSPLFGFCVVKNVKWTIFEWWSNADCGWNEMKWNEMKKNNVK